MIKVSEVGIPKRIAHVSDVGWPAVQVSVIQLEIAMKGSLHQRWRLETQWLDWSCGKLFSVPATVPESPCFHRPVGVRQARPASLWVAVGIPKTSNGFYISYSRCGGVSNFKHNLSWWSGSLHTEFEDSSSNSSTSARNGKVCTAVVLITRNLTFSSSFCGQTRIGFFWFQKSDTYFAR
jgi:hypothetical protein